MICKMIYAGSPSLVWRWRMAVFQLSGFYSAASDFLGLSTADFGASGNVQAEGSFKVQLNPRWPVNPF